MRSTVAGLIALATLGVGGGAAAGETRLEEVLQDPSRFDGRSVVLRGTLTRLQSHVSRKGNRYYTFALTEGGRDILVLAQARPDCKEGAIISVHGQFDRATKRIDAKAVECR
jgi:hypothetical protein